MLLLLLLLKCSGTALCSPSVTLQFAPQMAHAAKNDMITAKELVFNASVSDVLGGGKPDHKPWPLPHNLHHTVACLFPPPFAGHSGGRAVD